MMSVMHRCFLNICADFSLTSCSSCLLFQTPFSPGLSPISESPDLEEKSGKEEREVKEERGEREQKKKEVPGKTNTEKISMETLLTVFRGGSETQDTNRFASHLKIENIYAEVG